MNNVEKVEDVCQQTDDTLIQKENKFTQTENMG